MKNKSHIIRLFGFLLGLGILSYTIHSFGGVQEVLNNLWRVGWLYIPLILTSFTWMLLYTEAWRQLLKDSARIPYLTLLRIKLSGEGVNFMTPLGFIAGDPIRIAMLEKYTDRESRLRSVVIDRTMHSFAAQVFNLCGVFLIFTQRIEFPLSISVALIVIYVLLCALFLSFLISMSTGRGFGPLEAPLRFLKIAYRFPHLHEKLEQLKTDLAFYKERSKRPFYICFALHFLGRILGAIEIMWALYAFEGQVNLLFSWILVTLSSFVAIVGGFIPGALGLLEGLYANFVVLYGFHPQMGLSIQIVRRLRVLFWIGVGILVLDYQQIFNFFNKFRGKADSNESEIKN